MRILYSGVLITLIGSVLFFMFITALCIFRLFGDQFLLGFLFGLDVVLLLIIIALNQVRKAIRKRLIIITSIN